MKITILFKIRIIVLASAIAIVLATAFSFINLSGAEAASDATFSARTEDINLLFGLLQAINHISQTVEEMTKERDPERIGELRDKLELKKMDASRQLESLGDDGESLSAIYESFDAEAQAVVSLVVDGNVDGARFYYLDHVTPLAYKIFTSIVQIEISHNAGLMKLSRAEAESYARANYLLGIVMSVFVVLLILVGMIVSSDISRSINRVVHRLKDISEGEGDLTKRLESRGKDELTDLTNHFNAFTEKLSSLVLTMQGSVRSLSGTATDLAANTEQTASAVNEISANVESFKVRSDEQGMSIDATSVSMTMLADGLGNLDEMISGQTDAVVRSSSAVDQMVANVQSVRNSIADLAGSFRELVSSADVGKERIDGVSSLIETIEERSTALAETNSLIASIAARTNLLSMNAAIEAAHAGEAGRGFSVVASEIRLLAENSSRQSKATASELKGIRTYIAKVVNSVNEADRSFGTILSLIDRINGLVAQIQSAMDEQGAGNSEVLDAIAKINETTAAVRERSSLMRKESDDALRKIAGTRRLSEEFRAGMEEVALGTGEINRAIEEIRELGLLNRRSIEDAEAVTGKFKVQAEA